MRILFFILFFQITIYSFDQTPTNDHKDLDSLIKALTRNVIGNPFPDFIASNESGQLNNENLLGKVVLINFWFESCLPCLAEFEGLNELALTLKDNKDFEFISFTWDNVEAIKRVKEKYKLKFKIFRADQIECRRLNGNNGYPTTLILDRQGKIKFMTVGGSTDIEKASEYVMLTLLPAIQKEL